MPPKYRKNWSVMSCTPALYCAVYVLCAVVFYGGPAYCTWSPLASTDKLSRTTSASDDDDDDDDDDMTSQQINTHK